MTRLLSRTFLSVLWTLLFQAALAAPIIDLKGTWRFQTDPADKGITARWFTTRLPDTIKLPGSMLENGKGDPVTLQTKWTGSIYDSSWYFNPRMEKYRRPDNLKFPFWLTPDTYYVGAAWYQKDITIPRSWRGKRVVLFLERPHTETRVWVDATEIGKQNSLSVAHEYDLTAALTPGAHTLTIRIDNRLEVINVGKDSHSVTDHTQGNWNGIVGKLELRASEPVWFDDVQVYPDVTNKRARVRMTLHSTLGKPVAGRIQLAANSFNSPVRQAVRPLSVDFRLDGRETVVEAEYPMGEAPLLWDEFSPALYRLTASLTTADKRRAERQVTFGMRDFGIRGTRFTLNGRELFLRGTVENCQFPRTGYAPMDVTGWERVFRIAKRYGLNHMRYHSFCPPEAAFQAADLVGFYLQPEGPSWANHGTSLGDGRPVDQYIYDETARMARAYGNYASFVMLAYGNEPAGRNQVTYLTEFVHYWQKRDPRRKYTGASVGNSWPLVPENEFMVKAGARNLPWDKRPESTGDYRDKIEPFKVPYVAHEMGQWCVFPNFREIRKYTGVYKARNFELFQEDLQDRGMGDQSHDFLMASGKLQLLAYKNEIERALRTPGMAGFQLLSLNDYSGQGTALVGLLDSFWEEKGYVTAREFGRFCAPTVPLARLPKFVYQNSETLHADIELAHFGNAPLAGARTVWSLTDASGKPVAAGQFPPITLAIGSNQPVGSLNVPLTTIARATRLRLTVAVEGRPAANDWDIWVYPARVADVPEGIYTTSVLDEKAEGFLRNGGKVLLLAAGKIEKGKEVAQHFLPAFWNTSWFKMRPPHTLGILLNPAHPAFAEFPTESHSNLQWWELVNRAQVMNLEDFPAGFRPLVQPIDTWFLNRRLGLVLEANVGNGRLVVASADLTSDLDNRPVARQLRHSLLRYMASEAFKPGTAVALPVIKALFTEPSRDTFKPFTKDAPDELKVRN